MELPPFHCKRMALLTTAGVQIIHETCIILTDWQHNYWLRATALCREDPARCLHRRYHNIHVHQKTHTTEASEKTLASLCCAHRDHCGAEAVSRGVSGSRQGRAMTGFSVLLLDGWQLGSEVHCSLSSITLPRLALRGSRKGFDEDDSEALRHLAAALPSTSWGPAEQLCGSQRRETRCILWYKHG